MKAYIQGGEKPWTHELQSLRKDSLLESILNDDL